LVLEAQWIGISVVITETTKNIRCCGKHMKQQIDKLSTKMSKCIQMGLLFMPFEHLKLLSLYFDVASFDIHFFKLAAFPGCWKSEQDYDTG
jgi:hypothetical protein